MLIVAIGVKAQGHYITPVVGMNASGALFYGTRYYYGDQKYKDLSEYDNMIIGLSAGVNYRYETKKKVFVETGFFYNQYGYSFDDLYVNGIKTVWNQKMRYHHFSVPVMVGYKFIVGKKKIFSVTPKIGIQLGYYTNLKQQYTHLNMFNETVDFESNESIYNGIDFAEVIGVEFGWRLAKILDIFVSIQERYSFRNMFDENNYKNTVYTVEQDKNGVRGDVFNFALTTSVGLRIKVGK